MKHLLGAVAAAMLLGAGCAHERGTQTQADVPASPQASADSTAQGQPGGAGGAGTAGGVDCTVINGGAASTSAVGGSGSQPDQRAVGGSSWDFGTSDPSKLDSVIPKPGSSDQSATSGSAADMDVPDQSGIGGSASEAGAVDDTTLGGSVPETGAMDDTTVSGSDDEADAFEDTGMGGAGGGGG